MLHRMAAAVLATALAAAAITGCDDDEAPETAPPTASASSISLADFPTDTLTLTRADFCSRVAPAAVEEALGGPSGSSDSYANGDRTALAPGVHDVAHEFGCTWRAADGTTARAWLFAPPVTPRQAQALRSAATGKGCKPVKAAPAYGAHSVATLCGDEIAFHGLFGDAWLSCAVEATGDDHQNLLDRAGRWCVTVAQAAAA